MEHHAPSGRTRAISIRELAFVRDVLLPRAWVQGAEVDELLHLRAKIEGIFSSLRQEDMQEPTAEPEPQGPTPPLRQKKPRHPKKRRGQQSPPPPDGS